MDRDARTHDVSKPQSTENDCPLCRNGELVARHCKLICEQCGYVESCEDIFPASSYATD